MPKEKKRKAAYADLIKTTAKVLGYAKRAVDASTPCRG
jgi:hypothetical protein